MLTYIIRRLLAFVPTVFVVSFLVFLMIYLIPGDPSSAMLGQDASAEDRAELRERMGLNRSFGERLIDWYGAALQGDLGDSIFLHQPVTEALLARLPVTLSLTVFAITFASIFGILSGVIASIRHRQALDWGIMLIAILGLSVPIFWLALNMIFLFSVRLGWFPTGGYVPFGESPGEYLKHLIMPGLALGLAQMAVIARITRSSMLEVFRQDYVRTARAKGLLERRVIVKHALRNALIPIITIFGVSMGGLLAGSVITETVFNMPGIGRLIVDAVKRRDYPIIQGGILFITFFYLVINLVTDLLYAWVNPRIRYG